MKDFDSLRVSIDIELAKIDPRSTLEQQLESILYCLDTIEPDDFPLPSRHPYSRTILYKSDTIEIMIARWAPGRHCAPHDHGTAKSLIYVLSGLSQHRLYQIRANKLEQVYQEDKEQGSYIRCAPMQIHSMGPKDTLLTLHAYTPKIEDMYVYALIPPQTFQIRGTCGAWLPVDKVEDILKTFSGHQKRRKVYV